MDAISALIKVLEKIFLSPRVAVTIFFVCLVVLLVGTHVAVFAPILIPARLIWLWIGLLLSGFYSLSFPAQWVWKKCLHALFKHQNNQREISRIKSLTLDEKHILQEFVEEHERVVSWSMNRLEVASLCHDGILSPIQTHGTIGFFRVSDAAWDYLQKYKGLIATPENPRPKRTKNEWMI